MFIFSRQRRMPFVASAKKGYKISRISRRRRAGATNGTAISMYHVYIIQSINSPKKFYTGFSENFDNRLEGHNSGRSVYTNKFKPWKMVYYCTFDNKKKALDFEKYLKTASGIAFRNKRLI